VSAAAPTVGVASIDRSLLEETKNLPLI
jgi:hypothetical protein